MTTLPGAPELPERSGSRRSFLGVMLGVASTVIAALLAIPVVRFLIYPLTAAPTSAGWSVASSLSELRDSPVPVRRTLHLAERDG